MVINRQALGTISGMVIEEDEGSDNDTLEKRGRGRPAGSPNKSNGLSKLQDEVASLNAKVEALEAQISEQSSEAVKASIAQDISAVQNVPASSNQLEKRVTVIQAWVENFHQFLVTSRITNSVDRVAEEELALIIQHLPDNLPIDNA